MSIIHLRVAALSLKYIAWLREDENASFAGYFMAHIGQRLRGLFRMDLTRPYIRTGNSFYSNLVYYHRKLKNDNIDWTIITTREL